MSTAEIARSFDEIAGVYDETREPLDAATLDALAAKLREAGVRSILEIGVGTGRIAGPLGERGFEIIGVDPSRGMLKRARAKGMPGLVRGSAYALPFGDRRLDAALFVHVLHLLDRPSDAVREAGRVVRRGAMAIVRPRAADTEPEAGLRGDARAVVAELLAKAGYPGRLRGGPWRKEWEFLARFPPDELTILTERYVTEPAAKGLEMIQKRASRQILDVPSAVVAQAVAEAAARIGTQTVTFRQVRALALWSPDRARAGPENGEPSLRAEPVGHDVR